jgi:hypothetical protein
MCFRVGARLRKGHRALANAGFLPFGPDGSMLPTNLPHLNGG